MKISDLENQARELQKSVNPEGGEEQKEEVTALGLVDKSLEMIKAILPDRLRKAAFPDQSDKNVFGESRVTKNKDNFEDEAEDRGMPIKKSGETKQPHGDQNKLNIGEMSNEKRIPKRFDYDEKMEDSEIDYPDNAEVPYYEERRKVHKSDMYKGLSDIQNDPDLSDEDKVFVVNDYLEKSFARQEELERHVIALRKSCDAQAFALSVLLGAFQKSLQQQQNTGRGRISQLSVVEKPMTVAKSQQTNSNPQLSRMEISSRMLKAQKAGKISYQDVALGEQYMNDGMSPPDSIMRAISE